ncbi:MAG: radical SAM protein [Candidatus Omnitrophota bacterium]|nr:radical SAM protein [Candidatus Omnitrophota bacterium]
MNRKIIPYALSVLKNELFLKYAFFTKHCINPPYIVSFVVTERCNARCTTCDLWKNLDASQELSTQEYKDMLYKLHTFTPNCAINFTGGEPFAREDFCEILEYASNLGFYTTVISNGLAFDLSSYDRILKTGIDYINFSINSLDPGVHDSYKGIPGLHEKIISATKYIKEKNKKVRICFSPVITKDNYKMLNDFVSWAIETGADIIDFIPILSSFGHNVRVDGPVIASSSNCLLQLDDIQELDRQLDLLIEKKRRGFPIATPVYYLQRMKLYYRSSERIPPKKICQIGFRNLYMLPNGDVKLCYYFPVIGNAKTNNIKDIWFGKEAQQQRIRILNCKLPCMCSAFRDYSLCDKLSIFWMRSGLRGT